MQRHGWGKGVLSPTRQTEGAAAGQLSASYPDLVGSPYPGQAAASATILRSLANMLAATVGTKCDAFSFLPCCACRFSFTPSCPGVYHESWSCFTHPPLEPPADRSRRRGEPICLQLKGIAVTDGDSGGPTLVAAERLQQDVHNKTRDAQVMIKYKMDLVSQGRHTKQQPQW